jgi:hypothetical protein
VTLQSCAGGKLHFNCPVFIHFDQTLVRQRRTAKNVC